MKRVFFTAVLAARRKAPEMPIVLAGGAFPVRLGFIESLARPGGNITGVVVGIEVRRAQP